MKYIALVCVTLAVLVVGQRDALADPWTVRITHGYWHLCADDEPEKCKTIVKPFVWLQHRGKATMVPWSDGGLHGLVRQEDIGLAIVGMSVRYKWTAKKP